MSERERQTVRQRLLVEKKSDRVIRDFTSAPGALSLGPARSLSSAMFQNKPGGPLGGAAMLG
jgi:hypothetical protein